MTSAASDKVSMRSFGRPFWVINGIELLERGAFYSMNAVLAVYMATTLQLPAAQVGLIASILFLLLYIVPLAGAALAEKYGYKAALIATFVLLAGGYATTLVATGFASILAAVTLIGFGAGIFKPIVAAVVSQTSTEGQRNYAFMIYYGAINLGATVFPFSVGLVGVLAPQYLPVTAFSVAALLSLLNLVLCVTMWKNLSPPRRDMSVFRSFATLGDVFRHPKFLVLLVIYSGFWFLYAMSLSFLAVYMVEFGRMPTWFNPSLMNTINPLVIVLLAGVLGGLTRGFQSIQLMIIGITLYVVGFVTVGFSATPWFFVAGIVTFSVGEVLTHPSFLAYVSKISPPDKVSVFLGYGFLPIAVGMFFGAGVGGVLYGRYAQEAGTPAVFWAIMSGVALVTVAALLIYNRFVSPRPRAVAPGPGEPRRRGFGAAGTVGLAAFALLMVPALVMAAALVPGPTPAATGGRDALSAASLVTVDLPEETGQATEGEMTTLTIVLPENATGAAVFALTWQDEAPPTPTGTNAPDTFRLHVTRPDGTKVESDTSSSGTLEFTLADAVPGDYLVEVELVDAGDSAALSTPLIPVGGAADTGNAFTLVTSYQANA